MNAGMTQKFAYEIVKNGAVIWRCFSRTSSAVIPSELEGYPVVAIAPYAFSAHMDEKLLNGKIYTSEEELPALCGNQLEEVMIPATVARAGRYCFYNCKNLLIHSIRVAHYIWLQYPHTSNFCIRLVDILL